LNLHDEVSQICSLTHLLLCTVFGFHSNSATIKRHGNCPLTVVLLLGYGVNIIVWGTMEMCVYVSAIRTPRAGARTHTHTQNR